MEGRGGNAGVGVGSSDICIGRTVSSPSHDDVGLSGVGVGVCSGRFLAFSSRRLPDSDFLSSGVSLTIS